jgi:hypothetical protein
MNSLHELQQAATGLARSMVQDTTLGLALTAAWLDPLNFSQTDYQEDLYGNEEDPEMLMGFALNVARDCSPQLYAEMTQRLREDWTFERFDEAFCAALKRLYPHIPLHSVYDMIYGVPMEFCGLDPTAPEFASQFPKFTAVFDRFFDVRPVSRRGYRPADEDEEIPEEALVEACNVARPIIQSLVAQDRQPYADLALLLLYMFSITDNSLLDMSDEVYWDSGMEPLPWERDQLEMADEACQQARIVIDAADRALSLLETEADIAETLADNVAAVRAALERKETNVHITWPRRNRPRRAPTSYFRATGTDSAFLLVRDCYRERDGDRHD